MPVLLNLMISVQCKVICHSPAEVGWQSCMYSVKEVTCYNTNRITAIQLSDSFGNIYYILGVYLPSDGNNEMYIDELSILENLYSYFSGYGKVIIAGDFNGSLVDSCDTNLTKAKLLLNFVSKYNLCIPTKDFATDAEQFTFTPKKTTLDYILFDGHVLTALKHYKIFKEGSVSITSDHLPIIASFDLRIQRHSLKNPHAKLPAWHKATPETIVKYRNEVERSLLKLPQTDFKTDRDIDKYINDLSKILTTHAEISIPHSSYNPHTRPEWTKSVKHLHTIERAKRRIWMSEGRPRGVEFESYREYKRAKRQFRNALDEEHELYMRKVYNDIDKAAEVDVRLLWKLTKRRKPRSSRIYPEIRNDEGVIHTDPRGVAETFAQFYKNLYTPLEDHIFDQAFRDQVEENFQKLTNECLLDSTDIPGGQFTSIEIISAIKTLMLRKAPGYDLITNEHIIHGGKTLVSCLLKLFTAIVVRDYIPFCCSSVHKELN